jgi:hypothetical protein
MDPNFLQTCSKCMWESRCVTVNACIFISQWKKNKIKNKHAFVYNGEKNTYKGLKEKQGASRFSRPVAIMSLNGGVKA